METVYGKVAGIDVHKRMLAVVVCDRQDPEGSNQRRKFGTTANGLRLLRAWLLQEGVQEAAMESTAQYWRAVWLELEGHMKLHLAQARSTAAPQGRKTDYADALRIVKRLLSGDLTESYVPGPEQRIWRMLARTRTRLVVDRTRVQNQIECLLEECRIKLGSYVSDLLGVTSRRILQALAEGCEDIAALAALGAQYLEASEEQLRDALNGQWHPAQRCLLKIHLRRVRELDGHIAELEGELARAMQGQQEAIQRLCEIPGVSVTGAEQVVAEVGAGAEVFAGPEKMASWIGVCPGREESAERSRSDRSPKGNRPMRRVLVQMAWAAVHTKGSFWQALFRRMVPRLGRQGAIWAVAHRLARLIWKILHEKVRYQERGSVPLDARSRIRRQRKLVRALNRLGYIVALSPSPARA